jgi:protein-tyrosine phosphatase
MTEQEHGGLVDISAITDQLYIAARPRSGHVEDLLKLHIDLVLSMTWSPPTRELLRPPFRVVRLPAVDNPLAPIPLRLLSLGVDAALPVLEDGGRVLVHCRAGRHRSVAMAACILIAQGMTADQAMDRVVSRRPAADPHAFYIESRIRRFESHWLASHPRTLTYAP